MQPAQLLTISRRSLGWLAILALFGVPASTVAVAQEDPLTQAGAAQDAPILQEEFDELPPVPLTVRLLRISLDPDASVPSHTHPGLEFGVVESGTLTVTTEGEVQVTRAGEEEADAAPPDGESFELEEGDAITYATSTVMTFSNETEDAVTILAAVVLPVEQQGISYTDGTPSDDDFDGVSNRILGDGAMIEIPTGPYSIAIERLALDEGDSVPAVAGPALLSLDSGFFGFTVDEGAVQVTRTESPSLVPNADEGDEFTLAPGDAAFFPNGLTEVARDDTTSELALIRFAILPEGTAAAEEADDGTPVPVEPPATITFSPEPEETPEPTEEATEEPEPAAEIGEGSTVVVTVEVNLRPGPSTEGEVITILPVGQVLIVIGPAEEGDGLIWFPVQSADDESVTGYVAADFIAPAEE